MAMSIEGFGKIFGFAKWDLGLGVFGNFILWLFLIIIVMCVIMGGVIYWYYRRIYKHRITCVAMMGSQPMEKWHDEAKEVRIGRAGDTLWLLRKSKRMIPPCTLPTGRNKWLLWERSDGELINIQFENVDEKQRKMGAKFIDTDMRMQRLAIEKNLQMRLQEQTFWQKYGALVVNLVLYVFIMLIIVVMFVQWQKTAVAISGAVSKAGDVLEKVAEQTSPHVPQETEGTGGSGLVPALILVGMNFWRYRKEWALT